MPSSVLEVESGGEGVADRKDDAPLLDPSGDGTAAPVALLGAEDAAEDDGANMGECGLHESFMRSMAAEHSDRVSSSSGWFSLVRRLRELNE